jgi:GT2 family glycosyltransferase
MNTTASPAATTIVARSPRLEPQTIEAVVTLPTFRRPQQLVETLRSLTVQQTARRFAVIVVENDAESRAGAAAATPFFEAGHLAGMVIVEHERGNCSAYNAGWATALAHFPAFRHLLVIDDDEIAEPGWLEGLCRTAETLGADLVGGPQVPVFADRAAARWAGHPVFAPPYTRSGPVPALYSSGNLLVSRTVLAAMPQPFLDPQFNFLGGGDSDFLSRAAAAGFQLAWCAEARVLETVPERRTRRDWIRARAVRNGVISTLVQRRRLQGRPAAALQVAAKSLALLALSPFRAVMTVLVTGSAARAAYPMEVAIGRLIAHFGYWHEQYREPEKH